MKLSEYFYMLRGLVPPHIQMSNHKIERKNGKQIQVIMKRAYEIPFYRNKFIQSNTLPKDFKTSADLQKFPVTTKSELREWMNSETESKHRNKWFINKTSGSTGQPLSIILSTKENALQKAIWMQVLRGNGYHAIFSKCMGLRGGIRKMGQSDSFIQKLGILRRKVVNYSSNTEDIVREIHDYKPKLIYGAKSILMRVAEYIKTNGVQLNSIELIGLISETVDKKAFDYIKEVFGAKVFIAYGNEETGNSAFTIYDDPEKYYISRDTHIINLYDTENRLSNKGRMIITSLYQKTFPIINYDIGDYAEKLDANVNSYLKNIRGKSYESIKFADGTSITGHPLYDIIELSEYILQARFVQKSFECLHVMVSLKDGFRKRVEECMKDFVSKIRSAIGHPEVEITYEIFNVLPPDENGKIRFIVPLKQ